MPTIQGIVEVQSEPGNTTRIVLDPNNADITAGGSGSAGNLILKDGNGAERAKLGNTLLIRAADGSNICEVTSGAGLFVGGTSQAGEITLQDSAGQQTVRLESATKSLRLGSASSPTVRLETGNAWFGGNGTNGDVLLYRHNGDNTTVAKATIRLSGGDANLRMGGNGADGDLLLYAAGGNVASTAGATIHLSGDSGNMRMGGNGADGDITLQAEDGTNRIRLDAGGGNIWLGGNGQDGDLVLFSSSGDNQTVGSASIHLDGQAGDITLRNADCAEEFDLGVEEAEPGTVMVLDEHGRLVTSFVAYDKRVAGVVSGAGEYRPAIVLDRQDSETPRAAIALTGKAYCKVDASYGAVAAGDLLTTSPTAGHAMKAGDRERAFGAVIGKALRPLEAGAGLIPVLIALQ